MKKEALISVIIPCYNASQYIENCLQSLLKSTHKDFEVVVVDDGSTDSTLKILDKYKELSYIHIFRLKENKGPSLARNYGVKKSKGDYLLFLDSDTVVNKTCIKEIVRKLEKNEKIGAIQTKLICKNTNKIDSAGHFLSPFGFPFEVGIGEEEERHNEEVVIFGARGAGMAVKRRVFSEIGGFDEDYLIYGEETDLCWRIWLAGYHIHYLPQAKVYHFPKSSLSPQTEHRIFYEGAKNNTCNILKNTPARILLWMLPLHILAWILLSLKLILQKRIKLSFWIYSGLLWNLKNINKTLKKRHDVAFYTKPNNDTIKIMFGRINLNTLLSKGWRWFWNV